MCFGHFPTFNLTTNPPWTLLHRCNWHGPLLCTSWFHQWGSEHSMPLSVSDPPSLAVDKSQDASNSSQVPLHFQPEGSLQDLARHAQYQRWGGKLCSGEDTVLYSTVVDFFFWDILISKISCNWKMANMATLQLVLNDYMTMYTGFYNNASIWQRITTIMVRRY